MLKVPYMIQIENFKFPINKYEFLDFYLTILNNENDFDGKVEIETITYLYFRSGKYYKFNAYNVIRALMACLELSLEWYIDSFEGLYSKRGNPEISHYNVNRLYLKSFSYDFVNHLQYFTNIMNEIDSEIIATVRFPQEQRFDRVCELFGRKILNEFCNFLNRNEEKIVSDYITKTEKNKNTIKNSPVADSSFKKSFIQEIIKTAEKILTDTCNRNTLSLITKIIGEVNQTNLKFRNGETGYGYYHIFNFFDYLKRNDVSYFIDKRTLRDYIHNYCYHHDFKLEHNLIKALEDIFYGSIPIIKQVVELLNRPQRTNFNYLSYSQAFCNCIILCENQDDHKKVLLKRKLWRKLNTVTSHDMNIYYCDLDEKGKLLGYDVRESLKKEGDFKLSKSNVPCLLLWLDDINEYELVELKNIKVDSYFRVIKHLVSIIDDFNTYEVNQMTRSQIFLEAVNTARQVVDDILDELGGISVRIDKIEKSTIGIIGKGKIEKSKLVNNVKEYNVNKSEIDLQKLKEELSTLGEYLKKKERKTNEEKILLSDILDIQQVADTDDVEKIESSIKSKASDLFKNIALGVGAGIIANILSKVMGIS